MKRVDLPAFGNPTIPQLTDKQFILSRLTCPRPKPWAFRYFIRNACLLVIFKNFLYPPLKPGPGQKDTPSTFFALEAKIHAHTNYFPPILATRMHFFQTYNLPQRIFSHQHNTSHSGQIVQQSADLPENPFHVLRTINLGK